MSGKADQSLSRRERQIMDVIYAAEQATALEIKARMADAPSYSTVRALLRILVNKGHLTHQSVSGKYVYKPVRPRSHAARGALRGVLHTFFDNSAIQAVAAMLDVADAKLSEREFDQLSRLIEQAKSRGSRK